MKISVVVPVYNVEKYLHQCIDSLLIQDYPDFEIVLVDDGSSDGCRKICDEYAAKHPGVRTIHQKNAGVSTARNVGIGMAKGDFITFVDADDWVDPDYLSILGKNMRGGGMSVCGHIRESGVLGCSKTILPDHMGRVSMTKKEALKSVLDFRGMRGYICSKLFDRGLIVEYAIRFREDVSIREDELFVIQYLSHIREDISCAPKAAYHYRIHSESALRSRYAAPMGRTLSVFAALEEEARFLEQFPELAERVQAGIVFEKALILDVLVTNGCKEHELYQAYLKDVRSGLLPYLRCDMSEPVRRKLRVLLCAIHPKVSWCAYRLWTNMKR